MGRSHERKNTGSTRQQDIGDNVIAHWKKGYRVQLGLQNQVQENW